MVAVPHNRILLIYKGLSGAPDKLFSFGINLGVRRDKTGVESRMQESHRQGVANQSDLESCAGGRKATREALTREYEAEY
jgi:hypothetical protein